MTDSIERPVVVPEHQALAALCEASNGAQGYIIIDETVIQLSVYSETSDDGPIFYVSATTETEDGEDEKRQQARVTNTSVTQDFEDLNLQQVIESLTAAITTKKALFAVLEDHFPEGHHQEVNRDGDYADVVFYETTEIGPGLDQRSCPIGTVSINRNGNHNVEAQIHYTASTVAQMFDDIIASENLEPA